METASVSMDTGHPTHPLFTSMKRGWEDSSGEVRVLTTPQLMGILATRIGEQAQDCLPSTRPRQELFSRLSGVCRWSNDPEGFLQELAVSSSLHRC